LGPQIALLLPLWLLGVVAHDLSARSWMRRSVWVLGSLVAAGLVAAFGVAAREDEAAAGVTLQRVQLTLVFGTLIFFSFFVPAIALTRNLRASAAPRLQPFIRRLGDMT